MILRVESTNQFKRDLRTILKSGSKNIADLKCVVDMLASGQKLPYKYRDHLLKGDYQGMRECHINPDWLLVYRVEKDVLVLTLVRTGSHSELFRNR